MHTPSAGPTLHRRSLLRTAHVAGTTLALLLAPAYAASAQSPDTQGRHWEFRVTGGALIATGDQRNDVKDAQMSAAQLSWLVRPSLAITGTLGWARSRDLASVGRPKLDVFTSDLGVEARPRTWFADRAVSFAPFVGAGAGARSYNYRKLDVAATNNLAGYGAVGGELGVGRVGVRVEARDYVSGFEPLTGIGASGTRNDVVFMVGLRLDRQRATRR